MNILKIQKPFFTAGTQYNWQGDPTGIGISIALLNNLEDNEKIRIQIGNERKVYSMTKEKAREIYHRMDKRNKWRKDPSSVWLIILPIKDFTIEI